MSSNSMDNITTREFVGVKCEVKHLKQKYVEGKEVITEADAPPDKDKNNAEHHLFPLIEMQKFDKDNNPTITTLLINSKHLLATLRGVVRSHPANNENFDRPTELESPFELLYHHRSELSDEALKLSGDAALHLDLLTTYLDNQKWALAERLIEREVPVITFDLLWYIFKPGDLVYMSENNEPSLYWLLRAGYGEPVVHGISWKYLQLDCLYQGHDGKKIGMVAKSIKIMERQQFLWGMALRKSPAYRYFH